LESRRREISIVRGVQGPRGIYTKFPTKRESAVDTLQRYSTVPYEMCGSPGASTKMQEVVEVAVKSFQKIFGGSPQATILFFLMSH
jgi:hypothetical protein